MAVERQQSLARRLIDLTHSGKLDWVATALEGAYQVAFANFAVVFSKVEIQTPAYGEPKVKYRFEIMNSEGALVDSFDDEDLEESYNSSGFGGSWFDRLSEMHETVRRRVIGADQAIDAILQQLDIISRPDVRATRAPEEDIPF